MYVENQQNLVPLSQTATKGQSDTVDQQSFHAEFNSNLYQHVGSGLSGDSLAGSFHVFSIVNPEILPVIAVTAQIVCGRLTVVNQLVDAPMEDFVWQRDTAKGTVDDLESTLVPLTANVPVEVPIGTVAFNNLSADFSQWPGGRIAAHGHVQLCGSVVDVRDLTLREVIRSVTLEFSSKRHILNSVNIGVPHFSAMTEV